MSRCFELTTRRPSKKKTKLEKGNRGRKTPRKGWGETTRGRNRRNRERRQRRNVTTMRGRNRGRQRRIVTTTRGYGRK